MNSFRIRRGRGFLWFILCSTLAATWLPKCLLANETATDFWFLNQTGGITHSSESADAEEIAICMQGRKVVMQAQVNSKTGLSYTARFFNLRSHVPKTRNFTFQSRSDTLPEIWINNHPFQFPKPSSVTFDGMLTIAYPAKEGVAVTRTVYPSMDKAAVIEQWRVRNESNRVFTLAIASGRAERSTGHEGMAIWNCAEINEIQVKSGGSMSIPITLQCRLRNELDYVIDVDSEYRARKALVDAAWKGPGRLETPEPLIDAAFALQKLHVLESPIETGKGVITHNGSLRYSPGIWANDPVEYSSPLFPFFGDADLNQASMNMYRVWLDHCNKNGIVPFPGSFEKPDLKLTQIDRGDNAMMLYGLSKFLLFQGDRDAANELWPLIEYSAESIRTHTTNDGIVASKTDEMEGRYPTGSANLSTSSLAYGGYRLAAYLARSLGKGVAGEFDRRADALRIGIENYFGAQIGGYRTYRYFKENDKLRGWILLPLAMGIYERKEGTVAALLSDALWPNRMNGGDILAQADRDTEWGRETYYALRALFKTGHTETATELTRRVVKAQIFGSKGPYPDEDAIDMLCPGSLYPRVFTEGVFGIVPTGLDSFACTPWLPKDWPRMALRDVRAFGRTWDLVVERTGDQQRIIVSCGNRVILDETGTAGKTYVIAFPVDDRR